MTLESLTLLNVLTSNKIRNNNTDFLVFTQGTLNH
jgi:hypothetical protein